MPLSSRCKPPFNNKNISNKNLDDIPLFQEKSTNESKPILPQLKTIENPNKFLKTQLIEMESLAATPKTSQNKVITKYQKIKIRKSGKNYSFKSGKNSYESDVGSKNCSIHLCWENESVYTLRSEMH